MACWAARCSGRIIPALAGNTSWELGRAYPLGDHPRSRGEYSQPPYGGGRRNGSSPLSRGIRVSWRRAGAGGRIIPALAGNTIHEKRFGRTNPDHPRSRGEYWFTGFCEGPDFGSSPLSRGILFPTAR